MLPNQPCPTDLLPTMCSCFRSAAEQPLCCRALAQLSECPLMSPLSMSSRATRSLHRRVFQLHRQYALSRAYATEPDWLAGMRARADNDKQFTISYEMDFYTEDKFRRAKFEFDPDTWDAIELPEHVKDKLCLEQRDREYVCIGEGFTFPDNNDNPVVNSPDNPASFWWDPSSSTPKMLIQLGPHFPPALWLPVKPDYDALKRVFSEFLSVDAHMMKKHMLYFEGMQAEMEAKAGRPLAEIQPERMRDLIVDNRRRVDPASVEMDWEQTSNLFIGTVDYYREGEESFLNNPFLFAWPVLLGHENHHQQDSLIKTSVFRSVYSKSTLTVVGREDLQIDPTAPDEQQFAMHVPLFATVNYPKNQRMCGGAGLVKRFNRLFGTSHALDTPVDVLAACVGNVVKGPAALREDLEHLVAALPAVSRLERERRECANSISMLVAHLAVLRDAGWREDILGRFKYSHLTAVRVACAKGCIELGLHAELRDMAAKEEDPGVKRVMQFLLETEARDLGL